jgi:transposase
MLSLIPSVEIFFCVQPADMRRSFDGLSRMAEEHLSKNVLGGGLFVFVNKRRDRVKLLWFDGDGYCLFYKRLEEGIFEMPAVGEDAACVALSATELAMLLGGIDLASARRRKRYRRPA